MVKPLGRDGVTKKLLRLGGKLLRGCCCAVPPPGCPPTEAGTACKPAGRTGVGPEMVPQSWPLDPTTRGEIAWDFVTIRGRATFIVTIGKQVVTVNVDGPGANRLLCKDLGVAEATVTVMADPGIEWSYGFVCTGICCVAPVVRLPKAAPVRINPLP